MFKIHIALAYLFCAELIYLSAFDPFKGGFASGLLMYICVPVALLIGITNWFYFKDSRTAGVVLVVLFVLLLIPLVYISIDPRELTSIRPFSLLLSLTDVSFLVFYALDK